MQSHVRVYARVGIKSKGRLTRGAHTAHVFATGLVQALYNDLVGRVAATIEVVNAFNVHDFQHLRIR